MKSIKVQENGTDDGLRGVGVYTKIRKTVGVKIQWDELLFGLHIILYVEHKYNLFPHVNDEYKYNIYTNTNIHIAGVAFEHFRSFCVTVIVIT